MPIQPFDLWTPSAVDLGFPPTTHARVAGGSFRKTRLRVTFASARF